MQCVFPQRVRWPRLAQRGVRVLRNVERVAREIQRDVLLLIVAEVVDPRDLIAVQVEDLEVPEKPDRRSIFSLVIWLCAACSSRSLSTCRSPPELGQHITVEPENLEILQLREALRDFGKACAREVELADGLGFAQRLRKLARDH